MNKKTLNALKGSIKKWENIVDGLDVDMGVDNCELCLLDNDCDKCPVGLAVKLDGCIGTPYEKWNSHQRNKHAATHSNFKVECPTCLQHAKAELKFLKSLLPEVEK